EDSRCSRDRRILIGPEDGDELAAVQRPHQPVAQNNVRPPGCGHVEPISTVPRLEDSTNPECQQDAFQDRPHMVAVVDDQDRQGCKVQRPPPTGAPPAAYVRPSKSDWRITTLRCDTWMQIFPSRVKQIQSAVDFRSANSGRGTPRCRRRCGPRDE